MPVLETWPRRCGTCGRDHFRNPTPVSVVLLPVDEGVLTVRRGVGPGRGKLALPGGFVNWGESWQQAGVREVEEEIGLRISAEELVLLDAVSVEEGVVLLFSRAEARRFQELNLRIDGVEVTETVIVNEPKELAFPTHSEILRRYFFHQNS